MPRRRRRASLRAGLIAWLAVLAAGLSSAFLPDLRAQTASAATGTVELSPAPVNLTQAVAPNIVVTFDDSGSMASDYMGDTPPFGTSKAWTDGPWYCAGVIDASATSGLGTHVMNGVYYNPAVQYKPPVLADGTSMPNADATLQAVWNNGIEVNRPLSKTTGSGTTNFLQQASLTNLTAWRARTVGCPYDTKRSSLGSVIASVLNLLINSTGPYYYRYTGPALSVDATGNPSAASITNIYTAANWTPVSLPTSQYQNWANWWAYYRTRNLMAQTSVSRVFGALGATATDGSYGNAIRVAWQNLGGQNGNYLLPDQAIISGLVDAAGCVAANADPKGTQQPSTAPTTAPACYRSAFFNWIFQIPVGGSTPNRAATIRAGKFFQRGSGNTGATGNLRDPYWQPPGGSGGDGYELVCRQNFHMLVTDGYWNENDPTLPAGFQTAQASTTLPDGTSYSSSAASTRVFWNVVNGVYQSSLANIAFNYWATDLRPDLYKPAANKVVATYMPDSTSGVTTPGAATDLAGEIYFNPANDPANWPHLVQYMVTLGVSGKLTYSSDGDCLSPSNDLCKLRKGLTNSAGIVGWPYPVNNALQGIDDTWHAAVNSRGSYFNASNPQNLVDQLSKILGTITARSAQPTTSALNTSVLVQGALGFETGYSSSDWSGVFQALSVDANGVAGAVQWDAGAILSDASQTDPTARQILTSTQGGDGRFGQGIAFRSFSDLDNNQAASGSSYLSAQTLLAGTPASNGSADTGQARVDYLRGVRTLETAGTMRARNSLLGAIINAQAVYVSYPDSGYLNTWPSGSPEATAAAAGNSYEQFVQNHLSRKPTVYVGANDGMLHAFDASVTANAQGNVVKTANAGHEEWAYVPRVVYAHLGNLTSRSAFAFAPTVDATPVTRDVYFGAAAGNTTAGWHTMLVGGLRLGGRGVYALDITEPDPSAMDGVNEANAARKVLWEFTADTPKTDDQDDPADLGYTYGQPNIGRLANGKWVVLVPGGYFPDCSKSDKPADCQTPAAATNAFSSLFVLDAQTGALIRELRTPTTLTGVSSHGLSSPVLGDYNSDQIDDVAFAGDLNGNLWRFDFGGSDPSQWSVTLAYQPATQGAQPITSMPRLFPDAASASGFIVVFGTGKYLGAGDNTSNSAPVQSVYGILDPGAGGAAVTRDQLLAQTLSQATATDGTVVRELTDYSPQQGQRGWLVDLSVAAGERVVVTPTALFDSDRVIVTTLIPGTSDPCSASIQGALMVLDVATGGAGAGLSNPTAGTLPTGYKVVGTLVNNPPTSGSLPVASAYGGGKILVPGLGGAPSIDTAIWRRRSWRILSND